MFIKKLVTLFVSFGIIFLFNVNAFERKDGKKILIVATKQKVPNMDPSIKYDASRRTIQQAVYDGLLKYEGNPPEYKPWLAKSWDVSDDGKVYTFHLVNNAYFHNGDKVTAESVRWSFWRTLTIGKGPAWMLKDFLKSENIQVLSENKIQFTLERPYSAFLSFIPWWYIMNPKELMEKEVDGDLGQKYLIDHEVGSGPFKVVRVEPGTLYELQRVDNYWKKFNGPLGGVVYKIVREQSAQRSGLLAGKLDIVPDLTPDMFDDVSKRKGVKTSTEPALTAFGLKFNTKGKYTSDKNLRKAIAYAIDYESCFIKPWNGRAKLQTSPFSDNIKGHISVKNIPRYDLNKAKEYLSKSKYPNGNIEIEYVYVQGYEPQRLMGLVLIDNLKKINIDVKMVPLTWSSMMARGGKAETSPDIMSIFATPVSTDPDAVAMQYHPSAHGRYYGTHFYENDELTELIEKARTLNDWKQRKPLYEEIQRIIVDDQPEIFGMMRKRMIVYRDWVKGFEYSPVRMTSEFDFFPMYIQ